MVTSAAEAQLSAVRTKIGVLGGTFDPVHLGHLQLARQLREHLQLDQVHLIPCGVPVHRPPPQASSAQRVAMLELAVQDFPWMKVDRREIESSEPSWTHTTLRSLRAELPDVALYFSMGADAFLGLTTWRRWQELPELAHLIVSTRPGYELDVSVLDQPLRAFYERHLATRLEQLEGRLAGKLYFATLQTPKLSSSEVRERIQRGESLADALPPAVADYIAEQQLYV
jgi:nicotinate (nicotinamide) nucleotide adenylyltransferase